MSEKKVKDREEAEDAWTSSTKLQGTTVLATQVGGHRFGANGSKTGMLDRGNGMVLKALQTPPRGTRELWLYRTTFAPACQDRDLLDLRHFLPLYYGTEEVDGVTFLVMNNITHHFPKPNVLDLKMGQVTYDPEASEVKKQQEISKYPPQKELGFKLTGMMIQDAKSGCSQHFDKNYCRAVTAETVLTDGLGKFFGLHNGRLRKDVVHALLIKLRHLERWFQVQRTFAFYASSLLIVYSSDEHCTSSDTSSRPSSDPVPASPVSDPSPSLTAGTGGPDESAGSDAVDCLRTNPAVDGLENGSGSTRSGALEGRVSAGQKRGRTEGAEEEGILTQSASLCKVSRTQDGEGSAGGSEEKTGELENKAQSSFSENKEVSQVSPNEHHHHQTSSLDGKAGAGVSESKEDTVVSSTESKGGTPSSIAAAQKDGQMLCRNNPPLVDVRMIDFAHVFPASGKDNNYLFGLHKLISMLEQLLTL
ncbi:uncharacterized protein LOC143288864 isoform X2 [Babylonia areolata]